jgi:hypothetical protein
MPARRLLSLLRRVHKDEVLAIGRELFIHRLGRAGLPRIEGVAGAAFMIYHGEVDGDSDGPVEWCWPVPDEQAAEIAARFPDLTLRTEPAHQEAFVPQGMAGPGMEAAAELAIDGLFAWAVEHQRQPADGVRVILIPDLPGGPAAFAGEFAIALS